jgi:hypothetical protein
MKCRLVLLLVFVAPALLPSVAAAQAPVCAALPANIVVSAAYLGWIEDLIARSPTLQRQCLAIASAPDLVVRLSSGRRTGHCRARTLFTRQGRSLRASIDIPVSIDFPELLAHEFEHVLEQLEGLNLRRLARLRNSGVREVGRNVFETIRATDAGLRVVGELMACAGSSADCVDEVLVLAAKD